MMEELRKKIVKDITESNLPLDCVYYLIKDLFRDIEGQYVIYIQQNSKQKEPNIEELKEKFNNKESNNSKPNLHALKNEEKGE